MILPTLECLSSVDVLKKVYNKYFDAKVVMYFLCDTVHVRSYNVKSFKECDL